MDKLLNSLPIVGLAVAFALLWAWLGFFAAVGITVAFILVMGALSVLMGPD
jgi:hypothetical protein